MKYRLDIYTGPAMTGIDPQVRSTTHATPDEAIEHLNAETEPYSHAVLMRGSSPCYWNGRSIINPYAKWPKKTGANWGVTNPDLAAYETDKPFLIEQIRQTHNQTGQGMIHIAHDLLQERHPNVTLSEKLGWEATSNRQGEEQWRHPE